MARTRARKLPEILTFEVVLIAVRSLKTEKPSRIANSGRFQSASGARQIPMAVTSARPATCAPMTTLVGRLSLMVDWSCAQGCSSGKRFRERPPFPLPCLPP